MSLSCVSGPRNLSGMTRFFRNTSQLDALRTTILPQIVSAGAARGRRIVSCWSAGCSTGEEPFTAALVLMDLLPEGWDFTITATDVRREAVEVARRGAYRSAHMTAVPPRLGARYFVCRRERWVVGPEIRSRVKFQVHDVRNGAVGTDFDLVLCRNVLLYLDGAGQNAALRSCAAALKPGGWLCVGGSERIRSAAFRSVYSGAARWYRRRESRTPAFS